ncbi:MAG: Fe-S cluster assembly protein SufD [Ferrovum sp.]|nr:Fe-S cluster assembly protein SufD [Ferrovum sp.]NDU87427.1 Fe-S cluster assembly protein SufD [Ferrovum sp.]
MNPFVEYCQSQLALRVAEAPSQEASRHSAWARFENVGWPTTRLEAWKYTSLAGLEKITPPTESFAELTWDFLKDHALLPDAKHRMVFIDGVFHEGLSRLDRLPQGVRIGPWSLLQDAERSDLVPRLMPAQTMTAFGALNEALFTDGAVIQVSGGAHLDEPLLLLHVTRGMHHGVQYVHLGENSEMTVVEQHLNLTDLPCHGNFATAIQLSPHSRLTWIKVQQGGAQSYHTAAVHAQQQQGSQLRYFPFALSGAMGRNDITIRLVETHAEVILKGVYQVADRSLQDFHTSIEHDCPECISDECFKGVLDGTGRAVFDGRVRVALDAQKTQSRQSNHNLLLSDKAEVDTKPQLEIFADDVKCSHGTTVGQLDETQWFYLRSRGVDKEVARTLLIKAFVKEIAEAVPHVEVRQALLHWLGTEEEEGFRHV